MKKLHMQCAIQYYTVTSYFHCTCMSVSFYRPKRLILSSILCWRFSPVWLVQGEVRPVTRLSMTLLRASSTRYPTFWTLTKQSHHCLRSVCLHVHVCTVQQNLYKQKCSFILIKTLLNTACTWWCALQSSRVSSMLLYTWTNFVKMNLLNPCLFCTCTVHVSQSENPLYKQTLSFFLAWSERSNQFSLYYSKPRSGQI